MDNLEMTKDTEFPATCCIAEKNKSSILNKLALNLKKQFKLALIGCIMGTVSGLLLGGGSSTIITGIVIIVILLVLRYLWVDSIINYEIVYSATESQVFDLKFIREGKSQTIAILPNQIFRVEYSPNGNIARIETAEKTISINVEHYNGQLRKLVELLRINDPFLKPGAQVKPAQNVAENEIFSAKRLTTFNLFGSLFGVTIGIYSIMQFIQAYYPNWWNYTCMGACAPIGLIILVFCIGNQIKPQQILINSSGISIKGLIGKRKISFETIKNLIVETTVNPAAPWNEMMKNVKVKTEEANPIVLFNLGIYENGNHILSIIMHYLGKPIEWVEI